MQFCPRIVGIGLLFSSFFSISNAAGTFYEDLAYELSLSPGKVSECQCLPGMVRNLDHLERSLRGQIDRKAPEVLSKFKKMSQSPTLLFFGSGMLLNELTIVSSLMSAGIAPRIVLIDHEYSFQVGKKIEGKPEELEAALNKFSVIVARLGIKYKVKVDVRIFYELADALLATEAERISAFFFLDSFYPAEYGLKFLKNAMSDTFKAQGPPSANYDTFLFFLGKKDDGSLKFPVEETDKKPPTAGRDPAVLNIYKMKVRNKRVESENLIFQSIQ
jgi:hypothetical protein